MRILMIAPQPFFEPRGTPFSEYHRIRALTDLGHTVDLITYPFGSDVSLPGLKVHRSWRPPFVHQVRIGPSLAKIPLDLLLALKALHVAIKWRFDLVHAHEEGGAIGLVLAWLLRVPHLYDMHSSLPEQLSNFRFSQSRLLLWVFRWLERQMVTRSRAVIVICRYLEEVVRRIHPAARVVLIENAPGAGATGSPVGPGRMREALGIAADVPVVLYTGTFEAYQGLDLLFAAMRVVIDRLPAARLVLVGGHADQVARARQEAERAGVGAATVFTGERPFEEIPQYLEMATALVSPRSRGTNTPLKIYQYLRAGKPIVATNLLTHTQVLDSSVAILTDPTPAALAAGLVTALSDARVAATISRNARQLADTKYTYAAYLQRVRDVLVLVGEQREAHYSYTAYADPAMADRFDLMRFSGPIGTLIAESQEQVLAQFSGDVNGMSVLDVGTGTGRAALVLARRGARVTAVDASAEMLCVARERATASGLDITFDQADAHHLPFDDRRFVVVVSLRVLMHTPDWRVCLRELCRVSGERVVFDYPAAASLAVLQSAARRVLRAAGRQVEAYRVLRSSDVKAVLRSCGYRLEREHRQFVLPIAFHKAIGSRAFTIGIERVLAAAGLLRLLGSPVTLLAVRCEF